MQNNIAMPMIVANTETETRTQRTTINRSALTILIQIESARHRSWDWRTPPSFEHCQLKRLQLLRERGAAF